MAPMPGDAGRPASGVVHDGRSMFQHIALAAHARSRSLGFSWRPATRTGAGFQHSLLAPVVRERGNASGAGGAIPEGQRWAASSTCRATEHIGRGGRRLRPGVGGGQGRVAHAVGRCAVRDDGGMALAARQTCAIRCTPVTPVVTTITTNTHSSQG